MRHKLPMLRDRAHLLCANMFQFEVCAFYQFARWPDHTALQAPLQALCTAHGAKGILLLAAEGINGTLAGTQVAMAKVMAGIKEICGLPGLEHKTALAEVMPFLRLKIRLKAEIVTMGEPLADPSARVGAYVDPADWNRLIADPDVLVIDTRNEYEVGIGSFAGAVDPKTQSFSQFPAFVRETLDPLRHKKVAMFCTGGIRCEKASSFMLGEGFAEVFHLKGGILNYLEQVPPAESMWQGACFVFDDRVAVGHGLQAADLTLCHGCRAPLSDADRSSARYERGVACPHCADVLTHAQKASARERQRQVDLAKSRGERHLGPRDQ